MANRAFSLGDVVQLKSGGPLMTIQVIGTGMSSNKIYCSWFDDKKLVGDNFSPESIEIFEDESSKR